MTRSAGLRGVGKTVLLNTLQDIAESEGFKVAASEITHGMDFKKRLAILIRRVLLDISPLTKLTNRAQRALGILKSFTLTLPEGHQLKLDVEAIVGLGDSGDLSQDLCDIFVNLGETAKEHKTGVVFSFDEVQFLEKEFLEAIIAALHKTTQASLPITLVGAGLPQLPELATRAKSYAERLFNFPRIGSLGPESARVALCQPAEKLGVRIEEKGVDGVLDFTLGYPYFLQEYGKHAWNISEGPVIKASEVEAAKAGVISQLDTHFFGTRTARCTASELAYLQAMARLGEGPYRSGEIAGELGKAGAQRVAPIRSNLIHKGLVFSPSYGLNEFTVPRFADFMRRSFDDSAES